MAARDGSDTQLGIHLKGTLIGLFALPNTKNVLHCAGASTCDGVSMCLRQTRVCTACKPLHAATLMRTCCDVPVMHLTTRPFLLLLGMLHGMRSLFHDLDFIVS